MRSSLAIPCFAWILIGVTLVPDTARAAEAKKDEKPAPAASEPAPAPAAAPAAAPATPASPESAAPASPEPAPAATSSTAGASAEASANLAGVEAEAEADAEAAAAAAGQPEEVAPNAVRCGSPLYVGNHPEYGDRRCFESRLEGKNFFLSGGLELDLGYAKYTFAEEDNPLHPYEQFYDLRGRFVVGPTLFHEFGKSGFFVKATAQLVAWVRERNQAYQINVDDVYGQVGGPLVLPGIGKAGNWDFQVGRFMTWRVYHKGLGFDLYTLEDNGAPRGYGAPTGDSEFATHTYEVNYIYLRNAGEPTNTESSGRAALHYFPTQNLGFELVGLYGQSNSEGSNAIGGRFAADFHDRIGPLLVRLSAAAEDRFERRYAPVMIRTGEEPNGDPIYEECTDCGVEDHKGLGGGGVLKFSIVEAGGGFAKGWDIVHEIMSSTTGSQRAEEGTGERMSYGGYLQLDPGSLLFKRPLILGAGLHRTEKSLENRTYQEHWQGAAYIALPIGFNSTYSDAMIKLVLSRAEASFYTTTSPEGAPILLDVTENAMTAARLRFTYNF
jgi:hypothetical protein